MDATPRDGGHVRARTAREQGIVDGTENRPAACDDREYREGYEVGSWQRKVRTVSSDGDLPSCGSFN